MLQKLDNLRESNEFIVNVLDNITSGVFIVDENARIYDFNKTLTAIFPGNEIQGAYCGNALGCVNVAGKNLDCGTTEDCSKCTLRSNLIKTITEKVPVDKEILVRDFISEGSKTKKTLQYSTRHIEYKRDKMVLVIVDDITKLEEQKKVLEILNDEKDEFLGIAAHDLRNPISAIQSFATLLKLDFKKYQEDKIIQFLEYIIKASDFSLNLLNDLLDLTKIEGGKTKLNFETTDLAFLTYNIIDIQRHFASSKNIEIEFKKEYNESIVYCDQRKIEQVLVNLLSNAIKFSHSNTKITVNQERKDGYFITEVKDQGQGIPEEEQSKLFVPFEKISVAPTGNEKSTGLGLTIVKKIVEAHHGKIWFESEVGKGTTFTFSLPTTVS
jgi:signal transduction histidine kinase